MTARKQFVLFFIAFQAAGCLLVSAVAVIFLQQTLHMFFVASHNPILTAMESRVMQKSLLSFSALALLITVLSLPVGMALSRVLAAPYLRVLQRFALLARDRLSAGVSREIDTNERALLEGYAVVLLSDMEKLKDYEKARAWKEGARMLMHELKNPLTPLKLSAQQLLISQPADTTGDVSRLLASLGDMEKILAIFKDLVNIEFGPKQVIDAVELMDDFLQQAVPSGKPVKVHKETTSGTVPVLTERTLVRMVLINLINNSLEENPAACVVRIVERETGLHVDVLTPERTLADPSQIFRAGYSLKGKNRGYGLFIGRLISEYLDLGLRCANTDSGVVFSIELKKSALPLFSEEVLHGPYLRG